MTIKVTIPQGEVQTRPRITVFGVGGAGGNAVNNMIRADLSGVEFVVANTDAQALAGSAATNRVQLGSTITRGLGAGSRPDVGRAAAEEQLEDILSHLQGTNMCFITAGMGGGTGTGAAPVIARAAREQGILTVGVVTKPFHFEGAHRMRLAEAGINELAQYVDTLLIIPNQNLFRIANEKTTFADAFKMADDVLHSGVRGVTDLMVMPGLINLDFADIRTVMTEMGKAMMGTGEATGDRRAVEAAEAAISNPLLDDVSMRGARGVLINITGGYDMTLFEVDEAANRIRDEVDPDANIIFGSTFDPSLDGRMRVSVVATGIESLAETAAQGRAPAPAQMTMTAGDRPAVRRTALGAAAQAPAAQTPAQPQAPAPVAPAPVQQAARPAASYHANLTPAPLAPSAPAPVAPALFTPAEPQAPAPAASPVAAPVASPADAHAQQAAPGALSAEVPMRAPSQVGHRAANGAFIPPRPAEAGPRLTPPNPERFVPQQPDARKKPGLFQRVFGFGGADEPQAPPPPQASRQAPAAPAPQPQQPAYQPPQAQPAPQPYEAGERKGTPDDASLDIPAFLRRQAN